MILENQGKGCHTAPECRQGVEQWSGL